jgi:methenyltetrahydrofolate cyclohydrolase
VAHDDLAGLPVDVVLDLMAQARPAPAAGSAAALAVAIAAALIGKTARLSARHLAEAGELAREADDLRRRALGLAQADAEVVAAMTTAGTPAPDAIDVPTEIGEVATRVQHLASHLGERGNPRLHADAEAAHHLAEATVRATRAIVRSNEELSG